ncbi:hypothetical protein YC2023_095267 [Brassica napus]
MHTHITSSQPWITHKTYTKPISKEKKILQNDKSNPTCRNRTSDLKICCHRLQSSALPTELRSGHLVVHLCLKQDSLPHQSRNITLQLSHGFTVTRSSSPSIHLIPNHMSSSDSFVSMTSLAASLCNLHR